MSDPVNYREIEDKVQRELEHPQLSQMVEGQLKLAHVFASIEGNKFRHVRGLGWLTWDGKRWAEVDNGAEVRAMERLLRDRATRATADGENVLARAYMRLMTAAGIRGSLDLASSLEPIATRVAQLDADPYLLNVSNGTFDLLALKLRKHDPADLITKVTRGAFNQDAIGALTPFHRFLKTILPDDDVRDFTCEIVGQALLGRVVEHVLPIWTGTGANGKGALDRALGFALGDYAITAEPDLLLASSNAHPTGLMDLRGVRWATVSESDDGRTLAGATMKRLTGGDTIRARKMRQDFIQFEPSHTVTLITNHLPNVRGDDPAIWRRIRVIPFEVVIAPEDQDHNLDHKLELAADEVLTWALVGWGEYQRRGRLDAPRAVMVATDQYQLRSDAVKRFVTDECIVNPSMSSATRPMHQRFEGWARSDGTEPISARAFGEALDRLGYPTSKSNGARVRRGICLRPEEGQVTRMPGD